MSSPKLAAVYARKSTPDDPGIQAQLDLCREVAALHGYSVPDHPDFVYADDFTSGASTSRTGLNRLNSLISSKPPFELLVVKDSSRLGRWENPRHYFWLTHEWHLKGVSILFTNKEAVLDPTDMGQFLREAVDAMSDGQERKRIVERVTTGQRQALKRGLYPGPAYYGTQRWYVDRGTGAILGPVSEGAVIRRSGVGYVLRWAEDGSTEVVQRIFEMCIAGDSLRRIAASLSEDGIPTRTHTGPWKARAVRAILKNPLYAGDLIWGRQRDVAPAPIDEASPRGSEPILLRDFLPDPPVSRETWNRAQEVLSGNTELNAARKRKSPDYLLSSLLTCLACGGRFHGFTSTRRYPTRRRYYRHGPVPGGGDCPHRGRYLHALDLELAIEQLVKALLQGERLVAEAAEALTALSSEEASAGVKLEAQRMASERRRLEAAVDRLAKAVETQSSESARTLLLDRLDATGRELDGLRRREESLSLKGAALDTLKARLPEVPERVADLAAAFGTATPRARQTVLKELIPRIEVCPKTSTLEAHVVACSPGAVRS